MIIQILNIDAISTSLDPYMSCCKTLYYLNILRYIIKNEGNQLKDICCTAHKPQLKLTSCTRTENVLQPVLFQPPSFMRTHGLTVHTPVKGYCSLQQHK